jgi:hypothetical protein
MDFLCRNHVKRGVDLILVDIGFNDKPHHDPEFKEHVTYFEDADRLSRAAKEAAIIKERKKQGEGRLLMQLLLRHIPATTGIMYFETFVGGGKTSPTVSMNMRKALLISTVIQMWGSITISKRW